MLLIPILASGQAAAQASAGDASPTISFAFERAPGVLPSYTFHLHPDGTGSYTARLPAAEQRADGNDRPGEFSASLSVTPATAARIFEQARQLKLFQIACASTRKGIADSGAKVLSYAGPDGAGSCAYHYTENKLVAAIGDAFQAMQMTLDEGHKLAVKHRYDRLGLNDEMTILVDAVHDGRAIELGNIAGELTALADDTEVLERVRERAATLLKVAQQGSPTGKPAL